MVRAAACRSVSAHTTKGDLPPSSKLTGVRLAAAAAPITRAVAGDPVKLIRLTFGCRTSASPAEAPVPWTMFSTPSGTPACWAMSPSSDRLNGANSGGLTTTVLPAASAGPIFHVPSISGAFHGTISAATPAGSNRTELVTSGLSMTPCCIDRAQSAKNLMFQALRGIPCA